MLNMNLPLWSPRWQFEDGKLQYKPYPRYPNWLIAWDLSELLVAVQTAIDDSAAALSAAAAAQATADSAAESVVTVYDIAVDALELATDAAEIAIDALNDAAAAQATADAAATAARPLNKRVDLFADSAYWGFGGGSVVTIFGAYRYGYAQYSTNNPNDRSWSFASDDLPAGNWYFSGVKSSASGIMNFYIDGVSRGTIDFYNATAIVFEGVLSVAAGVVNAGFHTVSVVCQTKHASSSGYAIPLNHIWFVPNGGY